MPPRISRGSLQSTKPARGRPQSGPRNSGKAQRRAQNAFAIAGHDASDRTKIRKNRLGEVEGATHRKRPRDEEEEEDEGEEEQDGKRGKRRRAGDDSFDEGSDSEGNTWTMGHVEDDDDSDIDSDEAFGESDEERFEGWTFRGSSSNQKGGKPKKVKPVKEMEDDDEDIDLDEGESADGEDEDDDDLGDDAIDLATALDQYEEEKREKQKKQKKQKKASAFDDSDSDEAPSEVGDLAADGASDFSSDDDDDEEEADRIAQLKDLISSMAAEDERSAPTPRKVDIHENAAPSEFGVMRKVDLAGFKSKITDPERRKALKLLQDDQSTKRNDIARKLDAPLPKRQQDKLDRAAAAAKAKETLDRWTDTVKHNRRAEHLHFGPDQPEAGSRMGENRLLPTTTAAPATDLESTIQSILQQSGLSNGKEDEDKIQKWEELQTNKLPLEEVQKRRAQLRLERELMFREEVRAKRIKKIKSKSYRRVHRRERDRLMEKEREQLKADGIDISEDEREHNDRRRAEERMGAKHRESKWAKGVKASGKGAWDDDARAGVTEMARRNEELRRRIEGKEVREEGDDASDFSSEDDEDLDDEDGTEAVKRQLGRLKQNPFSSDQSKLGSMAFMQKAEAARRARNDEDVERLRKELAGEESNSDGDDDNAAKVGRRKFGPGTNMAPPAIQPRSEFEEREEPESDAENGTKAADEDFAVNGKSSSTSKSGNNTVNPYLVAKKTRKVEAGPDLVPMAYDTITTAQIQEETPKKSKKKSKSKQSSDESLKGVFADNPIISKPDDDGFRTVTYDEDDEDDAGWGDENTEFDSTGLQRNQRLTASAFAGDNVEADFASEKKQTIDEEDERIVENVLPGWGAWTGDGLTALEQKNRGQITRTKKPGIAPGKRKDAKLARVIINEKRVKANTKYMSAQLPFPFETKEQYERSLRLPKGPEWTTKKTFQQATKPRVMVKQGVIKPMHKPLM
ncbi:Utp14-domain-containing protein [Paraphaeosphaeria sporulosa]|uniref:Utp14-domain-containing protein n=1 Tax=Paraphaeosphaeria sporulosa TaxID=1460663 RepID=A0A177CX14_9PLEO|nr:Utp14-domain-containing protein [Paraphaeosphaeria sporulosa]OAG12063.1 Utp14-domain-containing protein [Paraphaeosphaeria sporulosa]